MRHLKAGMQTLALFFHLRENKEFKPLALLGCSPDASPFSKALLAGAEAETDLPLPGALVLLTSPSSAVLPDKDGADTPSAEFTEVRPRSQ